MIFLWRLQLDIPLNAKVECTDGACGRSVVVLVNPISDQVTHLVVKEEVFSKKEYIVPVDFAIETNADTIRLRCSKAELEKMDPFIKTTFIKENVPDRNYGDAGGMIGLGSFYFMPYVTPEKTIYVSEEIQQIPPGELAVRRGTHVEATDGYVGKVDEFIINPENGHITHLVMREGHLWGKKDVTIPLSAIGEPREDTVFLKLDKHQIESLPTIPVLRRWS
jgi:sporulation protein YlmC with PRC-barrel domain